MSDPGGRRPPAPGHARGARERSARPAGRPPGHPPLRHFLTVGEAWPARVRRLGQPGDAPDAPGFPIARLLCGYRSCGADVATVWPAVPVAPEEAADRGASLEAADMELVGAGLRLAGPDEWPRLGHPAPQRTGATRRDTGSTSAPGSRPAPTGSTP